MADRTVAMVQGTRITQSEVEANGRYAQAFYKLALGTAQLAGFQTCSGSAISCPPSPSSRVVTARLIQEAVVRSYAESHGIKLTGQDRARVSDLIQTLNDSDPTESQLLAAKKVTSGFLSKLLETELLVQKVEAHVVAGRVIAGKSYHLKIYSIPLLGKKTYKQALELAGFGSPIPVGTSIHKEWVAAFRLPKGMRRAAKEAATGDYIGPFRRPGRYVVAQVLGKARRPYGRPARQVRETELFQQWLTQRIALARPTCFDTSGRKIACPGG